MIGAPAVYRVGACLPAMLGAAACLLSAGCALVTAAPPSVQVENVQLAALGFPTQDLALTLCVTNPNRSPLAFSHIAFRVDVNGTPFAAGSVPSAVVLPPSSAMQVPVAVATTVMNLGPQLLATLTTGRVAYTVSGSVGVGGLPFDVPFHRDGSLSVLATGLGLVQAADTPAATPCDPPVPAVVPAPG